MDEKIIMEPKKSKLSQRGDVTGNEIHFYTDIARLRHLQYYMRCMLKMFDENFLKPCRQVT